MTGVLKRECAFRQILLDRRLRRDDRGGRTGEARLALALRRGEPWARGELATVQDRMDRPTPRLALGQALAATEGVHAALDVSDGLLGDLGHMLKASGVGAEVHLDTLPVARALRALDEAFCLDCLLAGGDDYELLFTADAAAHAAVRAAGAASGTPVTCIGRITAHVGLRLLDANAREVAIRSRGYDHFR